MARRTHGESGCDGFDGGVGLTSIAASTTNLFHRPGRPSTVVTVIGVLVALCCVGFAVVNVVFEITDHFADGRYAEYAPGLSATLLLEPWLWGLRADALSSRRPPLGERSSWP